MIDKETESKFTEIEDRLNILEQSLSNLADNILKFESILESINQQLESHDPTDENDN